MRSVFLKVFATDAAAGDASAASDAAGCCCSCSPCSFSQRSAYTLEYLLTQNQRTHAHTNTRKSAKTQTHNQMQHTPKTTRLYNVARRDRGGGMGEEGGGGRAYVANFIAISWSCCTHLAHELEKKSGCELGVWIERGKQLQCWKGKSNVMRGAAAART